MAPRDEAKHWTYSVTAKRRRSRSDLICDEPSLSRSDYSFQARIAGMEAPHQSDF
jgi:hypothetical protein